jgi:hypothetical protein
LLPCRRLIQRAIYDFGVIDDESLYCAMEVTQHYCRDRRLLEHDAPGQRVIGNAVEP